MKLLVTGGCGFIGSNFVHYQRKHYADTELIVLDLLTYAGNRANLDQVEKQYRFVHGDIGDEKLIDNLLHEHQVDAIVHFAAESHVDRSILGPGAFVKTNVVGTANLLECARRAKVKRFVHISTDEVYGDLGPNDPAFTESTPLAPRSPYAASKASSDLLVQAWFTTYNFPTLITRCSNNYGPFQFPEKLIPLMLLNALADKELPVYGDGANVRDWIYVDDHCRGIDIVLREGVEGEVYNLGGNTELPNLQVVEQILTSVGKPKSLIKFVTDRLGHDRRYAIDSSKMKEKFNWSPQTRFADGLSTTLAWYRDNEKWWQQILSGEYRHWVEKNYADRQVVG